MPLDAASLVDFSFTVSPVWLCTRLGTGLVLQVSYMMSSGIIAFDIKKMMVYSWQDLTQGTSMMPNELRLQINELLASMTQTELAEKIGCNQSVVSLLASGQRGSRISYDLAMRIQRAYAQTKGEQK